MTEPPFRANYKDGFISGFYKSFFPNAQLELLYAIKDNDKIGDFMSYDLEGHLLLKGHFLFGRLHGENIGYYTDGTIRHHYEYNSGSKVGTNFDYYPDGKTRTKEQFTAGGQNSKMEEFDGREKPLFEKSFHLGKPNGTWYMYGEDGETISVKENYKEELLVVENLLKQRKLAAVGEMGLDFYWDRSFEQNQYDAFNIQIELALHYNLPIVIHSRESMQQSINVVREHQKGNLTGIFHCFSGSYESAREIIELGFYLGIGGVITYKKSTLPEALKNIGLQYLVLETDSPYLAPMPFRGKRNESSYLPYIAQKLAEVKGVSIEEVAAITTANAQKIFGN